MVRVMGWIKLTCKKHRLGHGLTCFLFGSKKSGLGQVFFGSGRVRKILTHFVMSITNYLKKW